MKLQVNIHSGKDLNGSREVVERLTQKNLETKLDHYLKKFGKDDAQGIIEVKCDKNKKWMFDGVIQATFDGKSFRVSREDYTKLDDLVNHLFDHLKESLSNA